MMNLEPIDLINASYDLYTLTLSFEYIVDFDVNLSCDVYFLSTYVVV